MGTKSIVNKQPVDVIIPTYDNLDQLIACVKSMWMTHSQYPMRFIIVNNGKHPLETVFPDNENFLIINPGQNLGWTGGLAEGLKHSTSEYVLFANDDILVPIGSFRWLSQMVRHMVIRPQLAAVGPASNCVMGIQNIFSGVSNMCMTTHYLIGFCMLVRRSALDEAGGIDTEMNTGDDIDLSMRFNKAGYYLLVDHSVFIYHHGFQTGEKVYGGPHIQGGWNSQKMTDDTNMALIKKHGFLEWWYLRAGYPEDYPRKPWDRTCEEEVAGRYIGDTDPKDIVDIGCGGSKLVEGSTGVDIMEKGTPVPNTAFCSAADIVANTEKELPFEDKRFKVIVARHILEHCTDVIQTLRNWKRILKDDGMLIVCCPDERISDTIILNPEHVHAFTPETLTKIVELVGFKVVGMDEFYASDSFTLALRKAE